MALFNTIAPQITSQPRLRNFSSNWWGKTRLAISGQNTDGTSNVFGSVVDKALSPVLSLVGGYYLGPAGAILGNKLGSLANTGLNSWSEKLTKGTSTQIQSIATNNKEEGNDALINILSQVAGAAGGAAKSSNLFASSSKPADSGFTTSEAGKSFDSLIRGNLAQSNGFSSAPVAAATSNGFGGAVGALAKPSFLDALKANAGQSQQNPLLSNVTNLLTQYSQNQNQNMINPGNANQFQMNSTVGMGQTNSILEPASGNSNITWLDDQKKTKQVGTSTLPNPIYGSAIDDKFGYPTLNGFADGGKTADGAIIYDKNDKTTEDYYMLPKVSIENTPVEHMIKSLSIGAARFGERIFDQESNLKQEQIMRSPLSLDKKKALLGDHIYDELLTHKDFQGDQNFADGGKPKPKPYITSNPNDPRIRAYNDSAALYNNYNQVTAALIKAGYNNGQVKDKETLLSNLFNVASKILPSLPTGNYHKETDPWKQAMNVVHNFPQLTGLTRKGTLNQVDDFVAGVINKNIPKQLYSDSIKPSGVTNYFKDIKPEELANVFATDDNKKLIPAKISSRREAIQDIRTVAKYDNVKPNQQVIYQPTQKTVVPTVTPTRKEQFAQRLQTPVAPQRVVMPNVDPIENTDQIQMVLPDIQVPVYVAPQIPVVQPLQSLPSALPGETMDAYQRRLAGLRKSNPNTYKTNTNQFKQPVMEQDNFAGGGKVKYQTRAGAKPDIKEFQNSYNEWATANGLPAIKVDGLYGPQTSAAVTNWNATNPGREVFVESLNKGNIGGSIAKAITGLDLQPLLGSANKPSIASAIRGYDSKGNPVTETSPLSYGNGVNQVSFGGQNPLQNLVAVNTGTPSSTTVVAANQSGLTPSQRQNLFGNIADLATAGVGAVISMNNPIPRYKPTTEYTNMLQDVYARKNQGFTAAEQAAVNQGLQNNYALGVNTIKQVAGGGASQGAVLGALGQLSSQQNQGTLNAALQSDQLQRQNYANYQKVVQGDLTLDQNIFAQDQQAALAQRTAGVGLLDAGLQNIADRNQFNAQYGAGTTYDQLQQAQLSGAQKQNQLADLYPQIYAQALRDSLNKKTPTTVKI